MLVDPKFAKAMRERRPLVLLAEINHPNGTAYFWSGVGTLHYRGLNWRGLGTLASIETSPRTTELRIDEVRMRLAYVDQNSLENLDDNIKNYKAYTWLAVLNNRMRIAGDPYLLDEILLDYSQEDISEQGIATLMLVGQTGFWTLERATEKAWSREESILRFGTDTGGEPIESGYDYITSLKVKDTKWSVPPA